MDYKTKVSVIITAVTDRGYLQRAIDSVKEQDFTDYEIILAGDGNLELMKTAKENNIQFALTKEKSNLATNFNNAVKKAKGKYLKILADDDELLPGALKELYNTAEEYKADVVFGDYTIINEQSYQTGFYRLPEGKELAELIKGRFIPGGTTLVKTESFKAVGGYDILFDISEGYILNIKLVNAGLDIFLYMKYFVTAYRHHPKQKSRNLKPVDKKKREEQMVRINKKYKI